MKEKKIIKKKTQFAFSFFFFADLKHKWNMHNMYCFVCIYNKYVLLHFQLQPASSLSLCVALIFLSTEMFGREIKSRKK